MAEFKITINGQRYDSPESMPPDVRSAYEEAMRKIATSPADGQGGGSTKVISGKTGPHVGTSVVVNRKLIVNGRTYGSVDELPADARQLYEQALSGAATTAVVHPRITLQVSVSGHTPGVKTLEDSGAPQTHLPLSMEPSSTVSTLRGLPMALALLIGTGLLLWALLGR